MASAWRPEEGSSMVAVVYGPRIHVPCQVGRVEFIRPPVVEATPARRAFRLSSGGTTLQLGAAVAASQLPTGNCTIGDVVVYWQCSTLWRTRVSTTDDKARDPNHPQRTAWHLLHGIREPWEDATGAKLEPAQEPEPRQDGGLGPCGTRSRSTIPREHRPSHHVGPPKKRWRYEGRQEAE